ncbi:MAG: CvpA family protein [Dehalococcoidia bacterium]|nr:CvpA family protein [Dehalococcoidia bacterium]
MHWFDLVIVGVIAWFTFSAFSTGLIREVFTLGAVILGAVLAGTFYARLSANIEFLIADGTTRQFASFVAIFGGIVVVGQIVAVALRQVARLLLLGPFDRFGGALFGFAKGLVVVEVLLIAASTYPVASGLDAALRQSALAPVMLDHVPGLLRLLPEEFSRGLDRLPLAEP